MNKIQNAGHFPWLEQITIVKEAFGTFAKQVAAENNTVEMLSHN